MTDHKSATPRPHWVASWLPALVPVAVFLALFWQPITQNVNFVYRDAGHFYYPYFKLQVQEWQAGRVPLWDPYENGGEPLLGNPTASVFYPGKLVFALFPYGTAFKVYLLGHLVGAMVACYIAARAWGVLPWGASLASIAYGISGFVLFQIYNVVFLVGAAWLPIALLGGLGLARQPTRWSLVLFAFSLAMQILGGDPQTAQIAALVVLVAILFHQLGGSRGAIVVAALMGIGFGIVQWGSPSWVVLRSMARDRASVAADLLTIAGERWFSIAVTIMSLVVLLGIRRWWNTPTLRARLGGWLLAMILAVLLSAVQILPTLEFASLSNRAALDIPRESAVFSLHPARLVECLIPNAFGTTMPRHARWFPFALSEEKIWVPTIYFGLAPLALGLGAFTLLGGNSLRRTLSWMLLLSLGLTFGKFGGVDWLITSPPPAGWNQAELAPGVRVEGQSDGLYWLAEETIPGFRQFRYPSKLLVFTTLGIALLAGLALSDLLGARPRRRLIAVASIVASAAVVVPLGLMLAAPSAIALIQAAPIRGSLFGPFQSDIAVSQFWISTISTFVIGVLLLLYLALVILKPTGKGILTGVLVAVTAAELTIAQRWLVLVDDQAALDARPRLLDVIEHHAEDHPNEPYRIHRTRLYEPTRFHEVSSDERIREQTRWERDTLQPKYAIPFGMSYAKTEGTMNLHDIDYFFAPWTVSCPPALRGADQASPDLLVYYPRLGYDLWNTRYFVLPKSLVLDDVERGTFTLRQARDGGRLPVLAESPTEDDDYIVLENVDAFPRAWVVHEVEVVDEIHDMRRAERAARTERLLYRTFDGGLPLWEGTPHGDYPLRQRAMIETDNADFRARWSRNDPLDDSPSAVAFESIEPQRVRLQVETDRAGLLVLADAYYPGWSATVDGAEVPIWRANRAQRGVEVPAGTHEIEFTYRSRPFEWGAGISIVATLALVIFVGAIRFVRK